MDRVLWQFLDWRMQKIKDGLDAPKGPRGGPERTLAHHLVSSCSNCNLRTRITANNKRMRIKGSSMRPWMNFS